MTARRTVPVAYVTKWAVTRGIVVVRGAQRSDSFPECLKIEGRLVHPQGWTEDKAEAEWRWHAAMAKARVAATRKAASLTKQAHAGPKWEES